MTIKTTVTNASGAAVVDELRVLTQTEFGSSRSADLSEEVPVSRLPAGEYLLTVQAQSGQTTTHREIRFVVIDGK